MKSKIVLIGFLLIMGCSSSEYVNFNIPETERSTQFGIDDAVCLKETYSISPSTLMNCGNLSSSGEQLCTGSNSWEISKYENAQYVIYHGCMLSKGYELITIDY